MIRDPFGKKARDAEELSPRAFARRYMLAKLWEIGDHWKERVADGVVETMTDDERRRVSEEIFHLVRMIELRMGLVEDEVLEDHWRPEESDFALEEKYCHPGTRVRLVRVRTEPDKYAVQLLNTASGEFIQSQKNFSLEGAMEVAVSMGFNENWLEKIGVPKGHGEES